MKGMAWVGRVGMSTDGRVGTGTAATRVLGLVTLAALGVFALFALFLSPPDALQEDSVRLLYVHVPAASLAYLSFGMSAVASTLWLWPRTRRPGWDRLAGVSAELGVLFTGIVLITGMLWGKVSWGAYWTWDARLTSTALLFVLYVGYLAVRRMPASVDVRAKRSAVVDLVAVIDVPIVHWAVNWWQGQHPQTTIVRLHPTISGLMAFSLFLGFVAGLLSFAWLLMHRYRLAVMEDLLEAQWLDLAIEDRQREGAAPTAGAPAQ